MYDLGRGFLPMLAQGGKMSIDASTLPTAAELFRYLKPSTSFSTRIDGKLYTYAASSFGPETPLAALALAAGISNYGQKKAAEIAASAAILPGGEQFEAKGEIRAGHVVSVGKDGESVPSGDKDPIGGAARTATLSALRDVKTGLAVYRSQVGRVPDTLDELLKGTDAFPNGFLEGGAVPKDGWKHALVYAAQDKGEHYTLRSCGPNGIDEHGSGDDVIAP
jgi:hypothetical protein